MVENIPPNKIGKATAILKRKYMKEEWVHKPNIKTIQPDKKVNDSFHELRKLEVYYYELPKRLLRTNCTWNYLELY